MSCRDGKALQASLAATGIAAVLGLAGCGGDGDSVSSWRGEPQYAISDADTKLAERASLRASDLPAGWTTQFRHGAESRFWPEIGRCVDFSDLVVTGESYPSDEFMRARDGASSRSYVILFRDAADARKAFAILSVHGLGDCISDTIMDRFEQYPLEDIVGPQRSALTARAVDHDAMAAGRPGRMITVEVSAPPPFGVAGTSVAECDEVVTTEYRFFRVKRAVVLLSLRSVSEPHDPKPDDAVFSVVCRSDMFPRPLATAVARRIVVRAAALS